MATLKLKTNLRCQACLASVRPLLDSVSQIRSWSADLSSPDKILTIEGDEIQRSQIEAILSQKGYSVLGEIPSAENLSPAEPPVPNAPPTSYYPLVLIVGYILGVTILIEVTRESFDLMRAMGHFMAGFFLVFSFFKLLNLRAFVDAYSGYDLVTAKIRPYGYVYPFIELALGMAYLTAFQPLLTHLVTLIVMSVSTVGVVNSLMARRKIRCACLGSVFNLPMSYVTLTEDLLMVVMAAAMLLHQIR